MLGGIIGDLMPGFRDDAESMMLDECAITFETEGTWNEDAGDYDPPTVTTVYLGKCKLQTPDLVVNEADVGEQQVGIGRWRLDLPVAGSEFVERGHTVTMTAAALDPAVVGLVFTVGGQHAGTAKTARRLPVEAVV